MTKLHRAAFAFTLIGLLTVQALWAGGLLDRDAQRLAKARETHRAEADRAFDIYATRVERANTTLTRIYEQTIRQYENRGELATAQMLKHELEELIDRSMTMAFPSDDLEEDSPHSPVDDASYERLLDAIGPTVVHSSGRTAPSANAVNFDYLVLYYTASWCGPCRRFTPELVRFYQRHHHANSKWDMLVVSGDRTVEAFENYVVSSNMPWYVVPFDRSQAMHELFSGGYPRVVAVNRQGEVVFRSRLAQQSYDDMFRELLEAIQQ